MDKKNQAIALLAVVAIIVVIVIIIVTKKSATTTTQPATAAPTPAPTLTPYEPPAYMPPYTSPPVYNPPPPVYYPTPTVATRRAANATTKFITKKATSTQAPADSSVFGGLGAPIDFASTTTMPLPPGFFDRRNQMPAPAPVRLITQLPLDSRLTTTVSVPDDARAGLNSVVSTVIARGAAAPLLDVITRQGDYFTVGLTASGRRFYASFNSSGSVANFVEVQPTQTCAADATGNLVCTAPGAVTAAPTVAPTAAPGPTAAPVLDQKAVAGFQVPANAIPGINLMIQKARAAFPDDLYVNRAVQIQSIKIVKPGDRYGAVIKYTYSARTEPKSAVIKAAVQAVVYHGVFVPWATDLLQFVEPPANAECTFDTGAITCVIKNTAVPGLAAGVAKLVTVPKDAVPGINQMVKRVRDKMPGTITIKSITITAISRDKDALLTTLEVQAAPKQGSTNPTTVTFAGTFAPNKAALLAFRELPGTQKCAIRPKGKMACEAVKPAAVGNRAAATVLDARLTTAISVPKEAIAGVNMLVEKASTASKADEKLITLKLTELRVVAGRYIATIVATRALFKAQIVNGATVQTQNGIRQSNYHATFKGDAAKLDQFVDAGARACTVKPGVGSWTCKASVAPSKPLDTRATATVQIPMEALPGVNATIASAFSADATLKTVVVVALGIYSGKYVTKLADKAQAPTKVFYGTFLPNQSALAQFVKATGAQTCVTTATGVTTCR